MPDEGTVVSDIAPPTGSDLDTPSGPPVDSRPSGEETGTFNTVQESTVVPEDEVPQIRGVTSNKNQMSSRSPQSFLSHFPRQSQNPVRTQPLNNVNDTRIFKQQKLLQL